jgi:hypothetical protein
MSFIERQINLIFNLGAGTTFADGSNQASFEGLRISATISKAGSVGMNQLDMRVNGLTPDVANALSNLGKPLTSGKINSVTVLAGNVGAPLSTAFIGNITQAWQDFAGAPDVALTITAQTGSIAAFTPVAPNSYKGPVDVATVIAQLAAAAGYRFENNGCSKIIPNQYYAGDLRTQMIAAARKAGFQWTIDDVNGVQTVAIWPVGGARNYEIADIGGGAVLADGTTAPNTGMVGYPAWTDNGIYVKTLYNPQIIYGGTVRVFSQITPANGSWNVFSLVHELESQTFNGKWFTTIGCSLLGHTAPVAPS